MNPNVPSTGDLVRDLIKDALANDAAVVPDPNRPLIDVFMFQVQFRADASKAAFLTTLLTLARPGQGEFGDMSLERLAAGPSYIEIGGWLGDQRDALLFMALGEHHGLWTVITPMTLGFDRDSDEARNLAGLGMVMISGIDMAQIEAHDKPAQPTQPTEDVTKCCPIHCTDWCLEKNAHNDRLCCTG